MSVAACNELRERPTYQLRFVDTEDGSVMLQEHSGRLLHCIKAFNSDIFLIAQAKTDQIEHHRVEGRGNA